jgi:hypothetical protein
VTKQINLWLAATIIGVALGVWLSVLDAWNPKYLFTIGCDSWQTFYFQLVPRNLAMALAGALSVPATIASANCVRTKKFAKF